MKYLETVHSVGDFITSQWLLPTYGAPLFKATLGEHHLYGDPIMLLTPLLKHQVVTRTVNHDANDNGSWRVAAAPMGYHRGLLKFRETFFGTRPVGGNWKPYTRFSVYGTLSRYKAVQTTHTIATATHNGWISPSANLGSYPVWIRDQGLLNFITFEDLRAFCGYLLNQHGPTSIYKRQAPGTNQFTCRMRDLVIKHNEITYSATVEARFSPYVAGSDIYYSVRIFCDNDGSTTITTKGLERIKWVNYGDSGFKTLVPAPLQQLTQNKREVDGEPLSILWPLVQASEHSIYNARAGLFHTQGEALTKMMGDVSRNFETLAESPGIWELIKLAYLWPIELKRKYGTVSSVGSAIRILLQAAAAGTLTWLFAVKPTLDTVGDILKAAKTLQPKYESSSTWSSDSTPFDSLPDSLQKFILLPGMTSSDVKGYRVTFHTECSMRITLSYIGDYYSGLLAPAVRLGFVPEPKTLWELQSFSFVIDWQLSISSLISNAQSFLSSYASPISSLGHSVFVELQHVEGWTFCVYLRSVNSSDPIDPSNEAWVPQSGVNITAAIPLILLQALKLGRSERKQKWLRALLGKLGQLS